MTIQATDYRNSSSQNVTIDAKELEISRKRKQSFDPTRRVVLSWNHIDVSVKPKKSSLLKCFKKNTSEPKQLLHDVSGECVPGQLLAIMGSSGAGKTTFLNALTGKNTRSLEVQGEVRVNGKDVGFKGITRISAYVQQDDLFIGNMTVREHLVFQSILRMDKHKTYQERMDRVEQVLYELGLMKCAETRIGIPGSIKGISGGERKRLSFASEVLTNPSLMFCDEPTSGLDSFIAQSIVSVLKEMAQGGRTVLFTIHQPSSDLFQLFDHLMLMAEGRVAYKGRAADALAFFERAGLQCPINYNPADFFIFNLSIAPGKESECRLKVASLIQQYEREVKDTVSSESTPPDEVDISKEKKVARYKASALTQWRALFWRCWISIVRDTIMMKVRYAQTVAIAVMFGIVFLNQQMDEKGIQNINGAIFLILTNTNMRNVMAVINAFFAEKSLFMREHSNGMYRVDIYFFCKTFAEMPQIIAQTTLTSVIVYWMIGLKPDALSFFSFLLVMVLTANTSASFGYLISCSAPNISVALLCGIPLLMPLILFGGFYLNADSIPVYLIWVKYLSWFFYSNEALMINQWKDVQNITCETEYCQRDGYTILDGLNFKEEDFLMDIFAMLGLLIFFRILALIALLLRSRQKT